ncbi:MAG: metallophosphoesterase [Actinomycetota bacterium]
MRPLRNLALAGVAIGAYAVAEARSYRVTTLPVPIPHTAPALRVLHLSDLHLTARNRKLVGWLENLPAAIGPIDLAVATGDLIDDNSGIEPTVGVLNRFEAPLGCYYVLGSHDYFQSTLRGLVAGISELYAARRDPVTSRPADTESLEEGLGGLGWKSLANTTDTISTPGGTVRVTGLDDPFLKRHDMAHIRREPDDALAIGLVHSPSAVSEWVLAGYDLILAGHTHGGQVRLPGVGALVTNCTLPTALASGLHMIGSSHLHVSAGLGTSKFAPIRLLCPPEATVLELLPTDPRGRVSI